MATLSFSMKQESDLGVLLVFPLTATTGALNMTFLKKSRLCLWVLCVAAMSLSGWARRSAAQAPSSSPADQSITVLDSQNSFFRWTSAERQAVVAAELGDAERTTLTGTKIDANAASQVVPGLPAEWTGIQFDDGNWPRTMVGRLSKVAFLDGEGELRGVCSAGPSEALLKTGLLVLRGKFNVADPAAAQLTLSLKYRGGVVVYLNGREVARAGLPDGALTPATPAAPYPSDAYLNAAGKLLPYPSRTKGTDKDHIALRDRDVGPIALPANALRKGLNVLAIEIHRSDYHASAAGFWPKGGQSTLAPWTPCALTDVRLVAHGAGVDCNARRPAGVQVWNQDANDRASAGDYGDPCEPLRAIIITGARNGVFAGKVVVSSDQAIEALKATAGDFKAVQGNGLIAASAVEVRYCDPMTEGANFPEPLSLAAPPKVVPPAVRKPALSPCSGAVVPIWVWVHVPTDALAGDYTGTLAISAAGQKLADVPVQLHVADWKLPVPRDMSTFVGVYQSPDTLAITYKVDQWSEKHWALMDRSMELLGQLGNQLLNITVIDQTKWGNDDGMVTWIRKSDGTFDYDYSIVERYLAMAKAHMGVPRFVVVHIYNPPGWGPPRPKQGNTVTVLDPKTGTKDHLLVPEFGTAESKAFWSPVLLGLRQRLAREGMEKSLCVGHVCENGPSQVEARELTDILGDDVQWFRLGHATQGDIKSSEPLKGGGSVGLHLFAYLPNLPTCDMAAPTVHKAFWPRAAYFRIALFPISLDTTLPLFRSFPADSRFLQLPGFGYLGLDYWPVPGVNKNENRTGNCWGRWPRASYYPGPLSPMFLTWPGPDGPEPITIFQAMREGLQETQAMCTISQALEKNADQLGADLAERCRQALKDELTWCRDRCGYSVSHMSFQTNHYGWQELSQRLYALAGEVSAKTSRK